MRHLAVVVFLVIGVVSACGGGAAPTQAPAGATTGVGGQPTPQGAQPTPAAVQPTPQVGQPVPSTTTVVVTLTGGPDAGTYAGSDNPNCAYGFMGESVWSTSYSILEGAAMDELSEANFVYGPSTSDSNLELQASVGIGPLFDPQNFREYEINPDFSDIGGTGTAEIQDGGNTAVIHWTGTTKDGVGIDATVNCPSVAR